MPMVTKKMVAMLLAGGQGTRLGVLTDRTAKPAVPFGGKYRIIDFPLSNCVNSDIDTVGVLTQYSPLELNAYLGNGSAWDLDRNSGGVYVLPPYVSGSRGKWYSGTANAIYQNLAFLRQYSPKYVLILSGDHIYKMNYAAMLRCHIEKQADATIAVLQVPMEEAHRFGIMQTDGEGMITAFWEKPKNPVSNNASMGIYIFSFDVLEKSLTEDEKNDSSSHDFGKDIIPKLLSDGKRLAAYGFNGYWKDVGTVKSLWEANMDLIDNPSALDLNDSEWRIYSRSPIMPAHYIGADAHAENSIVSEGCEIYGCIERSVLFTGVRVGRNAVIENSVVMPGARIGEGAVIRKAILGENACVAPGAQIGIEPDGTNAYDTTLTGDITLVASGARIAECAMIPAGMVVSK